ncbi:MAG: hypothetical protein H8K04_05620 [Nitrospira sp.]
MERLAGTVFSGAGHSHLALTGEGCRRTRRLHWMLVLMFTVLVGMLMIMAPGVGGMLVSMGMLVFMFMVVRLSRSMHMFMGVDVLMGMRTFHGWFSFQTIFTNDTTLS